MARLIGIDIRASHVRAALLHTSYRSIELEQMLEVDVAQAASLDEAIQACVLPMLQHADALAAAVEGQYAFLHRITLPATAAKRIEEILPFELEAQVPVDMSELVWDYRTLRRTSATAPIVTLTAAARTEHVRQRIELVRRLLGRELDRVGCGPLALANLVTLAPDLAAAEPVALIDLGGNRSEVLILDQGEPAFARTLSRGVEGLPESAPALAAELRQTFASWLSLDGAPVRTAYLVGGGAAAQGAEGYLSYELGVGVQRLPRLGIQGLSDAELELVPRYAKAIALAAGLIGRPRDPDLRRGDLAYQRGFGFLKDKLPLLSGLGAAIVISFAFSTWAQLRSIEREQEVLGKALATLSTDVLGEEATDPEQARELLERARGMEESDPMPHMDAFDVIVEISKVIPMSITHDIDEFDMSRGHVKLNGVVGSTADAQVISTALGNHRCFKDVKISKIVQMVNSDRQKYVLEFEVLCPDDDAAKKKKKKKPEGGGEAEGS
jgi:general secretion pathway protein L